MKNTYYYIVTLAMLILAFPVKAASEAEFGKLSKAYTLHADGSQEMRVQKELTLFTHAAMNRVYGESFIIYNPEFQTLKIHDSYTRQKDGTIVKTPENAFVEVLPSVAADAPAYNGLKEMVVVHTGLELGATIYLDYSVVTRPGYLPGTLRHGYPFAILCFGDDQPPFSFLPERFRIRWGRCYCPKKK